MSLHQVDTISDAIGTGGPSYPNGQKGVINAATAPAGTIGELIESAHGVSATLTTSYSNITSIVLTPGDWDISATINYSGAGSGTIVSMTFGISANSASQTGTQIGYDLLSVPNTVTGVMSGCIPRKTVNINITTTYYFIGLVAASSNGVNGTLSARRMR